jgi:hypothetical protein
MMLRILVLLVLWGLQMALVLLLIDAGWVERQVKAEQAATAAYLGTVRYRQLHQDAERVYRRWFVESGAIEKSYTRLLPDALAPKQATAGLAPWFFTWLEHRLDALWWLIYQAAHRLQLISFWGFYVLALLATGIIDGIVRWQIKRAVHEPPSGDRYIVGCRAGLLLFIAPLLYLSLPFELHPIVVPLWGCLLALSFILLAANLQHQV